MSHPRLTEETDSEMKQVAQGHRATKWQSRDSLPHAAPTGAHSGLCTPARPPPPARAHLESPPRSTPHQASDSSVLHPHNAPALHPGGRPVRARSCPRGSRGRPGSRGGLTSIHGASRTGGCARHRVRFSPRRDEAALPSETFVREPRRVPGLGPN